MMRQVLAGLRRQVLAGLSYAHQRLIVHSDIKPSNVLVTPDDQVKLLDSGIVKLLGPETEADPVLTQISRLVTPACAAPEQLAMPSHRWRRLANHDS